MAVISGYEFLEKLCTILGLEGQKVRRVVIDASIDDAVIVYVQKYLNVRATERIVDSLSESEKIVIDCEEISLDEKGRITAIKKVN